MSIMYDCYLTDHLLNVSRAFGWIRDNLPEVIEKVDILALAWQHDNSKYSSHEYEAYDDYFYGEDRCSDSTREKFRFAWLHHIHNNPHHWQYWVLINDNEGICALEMEHQYVLEMICDWWSFSHKTGDLYKIFDWYELNKDCMILHDATRKQVEDILGKIKDKLDSMK